MGQTGTTMETPTAGHSLQELESPGPHLQPDWVAHSTLGALKMLNSHENDSRQYP